MILVGLFQRYEAILYEIKITIYLYPHTSTYKVKATYAIRDIPNEKKTSSSRSMFTPVHRPPRQCERAGDYSLTIY